MFLAQKVLQIHIISKGDIHYTPMSINECANCTKAPIKTRSTMMSWLQTITKTFPLFGWVSLHCHKAAMTASYTLTFSLVLSTALVLCSQAAAPARESGLVTQLKLHFMYCVYLTFVSVLIVLCIFVVVLPGDNEVLHGYCSAIANLHWCLWCLTTSYNNCAYMWTINSFAVIIPRRQTWSKVGFTIDIYGFTC